jgi:hypothetical protein
MVPYPHFSTHNCYSAIPLRLCLSPCTVGTGLGKIHSKDRRTTGSSRTMRSGSKSSVLRWCCLESNHPSSFSGKGGNVDAQRGYETNHLHSSVGMKLHPPPVLFQPWPDALGPRPVVSPTGGHPIGHHFSDIPLRHGDGIVVMFIAPVLPVMRIASVVVAKGVLPPFVLLMLIDPHLTEISFSEELPCIATALDFGELRPVMGDHLPHADGRDSERETMHRQHHKPLVAEDAEHMLPYTPIPQPSTIYLQHCPPVFLCLRIRTVRSNRPSWHSPKH